ARALLPGPDLAPLLGQGVEVLEAEAAAGARAEARDHQDLEQLGGDADGRHQPAVAAQLVDADRREHLLDALLEALEQARRRRRPGAGARRASPRPPSRPPWWPRRAPWRRAGTRRGSCRCRAASRRG